MAGRFVATPEVPDTILDWQSVLFSAMKENIELLTGTRGEADLVSRAIVRGDVTVEQLGTPSMVSINLSHNVTPVSFATCAPLDSFLDLRNDVQRVANDLYATRNTLNALIKNLKSGA